MPGKAILLVTHPFSYGPPFAVKVVAQKVSMEPMPLAE
jgi:hypothetical protein